MKYTVQFSKSLVETAEHVIEAKTEAEARELAENLDPDALDLDWDTTDDRCDVTCVYPTEATTDATDTRPA